MSELKNSLLVKQRLQRECRPLFLYVTVGKRFRTGGLHNENLCRQREVSQFQQRQRAIAEFGTQQPLQLPVIRRIDRQAKQPIADLLALHSLQHTQRAPRAAVVRQ